VCELQDHREDLKGRQGCIRVCMALRWG
jgi:hypothetical protein